MTIIQSVMMLLLGLTPHPKAPIPTYPAPRLEQHLLDDANKFTVLLTIEGFEGGIRGTGVLIDATHVLTCAHMVQSKELWVYTYPVKRVIMAAPVWVNSFKDLAVLELHEPVELDHYAVFNDTTTVGQPIVVIGNTLGAMQWFVSYGMISNKEGFYDITTALIKGGNSGGPWLNMRGEVVALTDWGLTDHEHQELGIGGGINGETIHKFLADWKSPNIFQILLEG
jgi:S1-C subfamily serine protease